MKTKSLLFIIAAAILLSFTVITRQSKDVTATKATGTPAAETSSQAGFAMEDPNQW